ncbi:MAG: hypothetical protein HY721_24630 [Planctomycetes bacterium]|nr:hypothetical protein [Planctomycetota bacterium]
MCPSVSLGFLRGDCDGDGSAEVWVTEAIFLLSHLFQGSGEILCEDACDGNDDGRLDLSDAVYLLSFGFLGGPAPPAPGPWECGCDPTPDGLTCSNELECGAPCFGTFIRGDANGDGFVDARDLECLETIVSCTRTCPPFPCMDAADVDDDGSVSEADLEMLKDFLAGQGGPPAPPFPQCGLDPSDDGPLPWNQLSCRRSACFR